MERRVTTKMLVRKVLFVLQASAVEATPWTATTTIPVQRIPVTALSAAPMIISQTLVMTEMHARKMTFAREVHARLERTWIAMIATPAHRIPATA